MGLIVTPEQTDALPPALSWIEMGTKHCGRWALYGGHYMDFQKLQGCRYLGGPVSGVLVAGGSISGGLACRRR